MVLKRGYTASKTREAGRQRYSVIYRHPVRIDPSTGKVGRRVLGMERRRRPSSGLDEAGVLGASGVAWALVLSPTQTVWWQN